MHIAQWRQDLNDDAEFARRAAHSATVAANQIPCASCGKPAAIYLRCDRTRFSAAQCDACATQRLQYIAILRADAQLDKLAGVDLVTTIGEIDLASFAVAVLDGVVHDYTVPAAPTVPEAKRLVVRVIEEKLRRTLLPSERVAVETAAAAEAHQRFQQRRADLLDAQRRLHAPLRRFA